MWFTNPDTWLYLRGKYLNYNSYFVLVYILNIICYFFITLALWIIFKLLGRLQKSKNIEPLESLKDSALSDPQTNNTEELKIAIMTRAAQRSQTGNGKWAMVCNLIAHIFSWICIAFIGCICLVLSAFNFIPIILNMFLIFFILLSKRIFDLYVSCPSSKKINDFQERSSVGRFCCKFLQVMKIQILGSRVINALFIALALLISIFLSLLTQDTCLTYYNPTYGVPVSEGLTFSTKFSRLFEFDTTCPSGEYCKIYATLPEDGSTSVFINVHTATDVTELTVNYAQWDNITKKNTTLYQNKTAIMFSIDGLEAHGARNVHTALLSGLTSDTVYILNIIFNNQIKITKYYHTLPSLGSTTNVTIAIGGDSGYTPSAQDVINVAASKNPDVYLIGGDLAYDNAMLTCYHSWDLFLDMLQNDNSEYLIPIISSVGNHDLGFNALSDVNVTIDNTGPLYFIFFPQHLDEETLDVPGLSSRRTYYYHLIGNSAHISLDSGYLYSYQDQVDWLNQTLFNLTSKGYMVFINYHNPIYPVSWADGLDDSGTITEPLEYWVPLFENYQVQGVFENHVHQFKKTLPLYGGTVNQEKGIIYFGDGNIGTSNTVTLNGNQTGIMELMGTYNHIWIVTIFQSNVSYIPWQSNGSNITDVFIQSKKGILPSSYY